MREKGEDEPVAAGTEQDPSPQELEMPTGEGSRPELTSKRKRERSQRKEETTRTRRRKGRKGEEGNEPED